MRFNWFPQTRRVFSMLSPLLSQAINYTPSPSSTFSSTNYLFKPENNLFYQHFSIIYLLIFHKLYLLFSRWPNVSRSQWTSVSRNNRNFNRKTPFWWKFGVFFVAKKTLFYFSSVYWTFRTVFPFLSWHWKENAPLFTVVNKGEGVKCYLKFNRLH